MSVRHDVGTYADSRPESLSPFAAVLIATDIPGVTHQIMQAGDVLNNKRTSGMHVTTAGILSRCCLLNCVLLQSCTNWRPDCLIQLVMND